ncbi:bile acid:sodium symporter family protein [Fulvivirgaceae bacterium LMO-SS25]
MLNFCIAFIMFGVALALKLEDFKRIAEYPKAVLIGIICQFILLPLFTYLLIYIWEPIPSMALGMMMVAACPGGNVSNFFSLQSGGNVALSVTLTGFATMMAVVATPFNLYFYGSLYEPTATIIQNVNLDFAEALKTVFVILGIPLFAGLLIRQYNDVWAEKYGDLIRKISIGIFIAFIILAFSSNYNNFIQYISYAFILVAIHNAMAFCIGYYSAQLAKLDAPDRRSIAIETGIQNSGLGLLLVFTFFNGLGGMALVVAWWGIWHLVSGLALSYFWSSRKIPAV